uniref:Putative secreted protein n=1 Tax=Anopheles darlingi TaxID=43151 RepID=A0A2M4DF53_ANODA
MLEITVWITRPILTALLVATVLVVGVPWLHAGTVHPGTIDASTRNRPRRPIHPTLLRIQHDRLGSIKMP